MPEGDMLHDTACDCSYEELLTARLPGQRYLFRFRAEEHFLSVLISSKMLFSKGNGLVRPKSKCQK